MNAHVSCTIPEQPFAPVVPGQPPLSRWMAHIEIVLMTMARAKSSRRASSRSDQGVEGGPSTRIARRRTRRLMGVSLAHFAARRAFRRR